VKIVLGLGNPGRRYAHTRHNVGFRVVETLARRLGARFTNGAAGNADVARTVASGEEIVIARPTTFMNASGAAAARLTGLYGVAPQELIVTYDDVALSLGSVRVRPGGRSAGQKGMQSIIQAMGTDAIPRVRLGILGERGDEDLADYVLDPFLPEEEEAAAAMIERGADATLAILEQGIPKAMSLFNRKDAVEA
jgi:PTH1 family peptidyl-tRNA hydrolase